MAVGAQVVCFDMHLITPSRNISVGRMVVWTSTASLWCPLLKHWRCGLFLLRLRRQWRCENNLGSLGAGEEIRRMKPKWAIGTCHLPGSRNWWCTSWACGAYASALWKWQDSDECYLQAVAWTWELPRSVIRWNQRVLVQKYRCRGPSTCA